VRPRPVSRRIFRIKNALGALAYSHGNHALLGNVPRFGKSSDILSSHFPLLLQKGKETPRKIYHWKCGLPKEVSGRLAPARTAPKRTFGPGSSRLTPDALKRFAEEHKSCQMKTIFRSGLVWSGNNKLGSLRQRNCVWRVANRTDQGHLCLWCFGRGFGYAKNFEGFHAVCARVRSFHRGSFVKLSLSSSVAKIPPPLLATKRDLLLSVPLDG
jgi:hypothetical protein